MARFETGKQNSFLRNMILSVLIFMIILFLFYTGISSLSDTSEREQETTLYSAITESAVHYYAVNGYYPEDLNTLIDDYGITYDKEHFFVDYQPQGENIMPEITVIKKGR